MEASFIKAAFSLLILIANAPPRVYSQAAARRLVAMTIVENASSTGAFCLDGSLPAYHFDKGFGEGAMNWLLQFEGGGWCESVRACSERAATRRGSTSLMNKLATFSGILSNDSSQNPDFYNWNRVKLRYCDGASFTGDADVKNGSKLHFKGQKIWLAIVNDLLPKGLGKAEKALLSGCSAGGLSAFHHCDEFASYLPKDATVKCLGDAGFFLDIKDVSQNYKMRSFYKKVIALQGSLKNLNKDCTTSRDPDLCFFPQYALPYVKTPFFILNTAYDVFQIRHIFVPPIADPQDKWHDCKLNPARCSPAQMEDLQGFRQYMLDNLQFVSNSTSGGMFINSCFAHCQSELQDTWFGPKSPRVNNKTIAETIGDWYFERRVSKEIDCPYPCDSTCHDELTDI